MRYFNLLLLLLSSSSFAAGQDLIDPTMPPYYQQSEMVQESVTQTVQSPAVRKWTLNTTIVSPYQRIAMINGKRVELGDMVNGAEVIMIDHQKVTLLFDGDAISVKLHNSFISNIKPDSATGQQ